MIKEFEKTFCLKNIEVGYLYFYLHFVVEVVCFYYLSIVTGGSNIVWLIPFLYDGLAFVPQSIFGHLSDKYPKISFSLIGFSLTFIALLLSSYTSISVYISLIILCIGNAFVHVNGAEVTLKNSNGKLSHAAIFVAGGSFGVVSGKLLAMYNWSPILVLILILTTIPFILLADTYKNSKKSPNCTKFNYVKESINPFLVIVLATLVVIIRGYMGYGIPTSWNKTVPQMIYLFCIMGLGKALGGILSDRFGIRKVALISTVLAIPFLCLGDKYMWISLFGVMCFSMTMAITLGILVSVLKKHPGLAFGFTTIGLFLGTVPIFFIKLTMELNIIFIVVMSLICTFILLSLLKKEG